jgi:hypothetical protein
MISRAVGTIFLILASFSAFLGLLAWPPGGLFFALPYLFFLAAVVFGVFGGIILLVSQRIRGD